MLTLTNALAESTPTEVKCEGPYRGKRPSLEEPFSSSAQQAYKDTEHDAFDVPPHHAGGRVRLSKTMQPFRDQTAPQPTPAVNPVHYERRRPEETTLYQLVQENVETCFAQGEAETGAGLPDFVKDEFEALLDCGRPTVFCAGVANIAPMRSRWPARVNGADSAPPAGHGAWPKPRPLGGSHHSPSTRAPMGVVISDSATLSAGRPSARALGDLAGRLPRHLDPSN